MCVRVCVCVCVCVCVYVCMYVCMLHVATGIVLSVWWVTSNALLKEIYSNALQHRTLAANGTVSIYVQSDVSWMPGWDLAMIKGARTQSSIVLDTDDCQTLLEDARMFLENKKWYTDKNIPYRRGYLLYGAPGCGKTTFAVCGCVVLYNIMCLFGFDFSLYLCECVVRDGVDDAASHGQRIKTKHMYAANDSRPYE